MKSFPGGGKVSYSGFVVPGTGRLSVFKPGWFNYATTIECIRGFVRTDPVGEGFKYALIMDNASWHKKVFRLVEDERRPEYEDIREKVVFVKLPPYSPDFNPIEQVWRVTRRENTHNVFFENKGALERTVDSAFSRWAKPNAQLRGLCSFKRKN